MDKIPDDVLELILSNLLIPGFIKHDVINYTLLSCVSKRFHRITYRMKKREIPIPGVRFFFINNYLTYDMCRHLIGIGAPSWIHLVSDEEYVEDNLRVSEDIINAIYPFISFERYLLIIKSCKSFELFSSTYLLYGDKIIDYCDDYMIDKGSWYPVGNEWVPLGGVYKHLIGKRRRRFNRLRTINT